MQKSLVVTCLLSFGVFGCVNSKMPNTSQQLRDPNCKVNENIERHKIPETPNNMSLPDFGQGVIGWATGPEGAQTRINTIKKQDLNAIQDQGVTIKMVKEWQVFYDNETLRNPCNPTAPLRAELMKKIAMLWSE